MKTIKSSEKGQILVLLALVFVGLLGAAALAIDGGMIYADRRFLQSGADAVSLSGAGAVASGVETLHMTSAQWTCGDLSPFISSGYSEAITKAAENGFTIAKNTGLGSSGNINGVKIICEESAKYVDVFVMLTRDTQTSFVQLFTGNPMTNTLSSVTRVYPGINAGDGSAIVSLSKDCHPNADGVWINGDNETFLIDGGIWSNSCVERAGSALVDITNGGVNYFYTSHTTGISNPIPQPQYSYHPLTDRELKPDLKDRCADASSDSYDDVKVTTGSGISLNPGNYGDWDFNVPVELKPGLYCINGDVSMNSNGYIFGPDQVGSKYPGVTIFFTGSSLTINGGADTDIGAPNGYLNKETPPGGAVEDLLIYIPPDVTATVKINGGSNNLFGGTLYMPSCDVTINGTSDSSSITTMFVSVIGEAVKITGTSYINFTYDPNRDYGMSSYLQVQK